MTPKELAQDLGLPLSWIYAKAETGELPSFKLGRYVRFRESEINAWLEANRRLAVPVAGSRAH